MSRGLSPDCVAGTSVISAQQSGRCRAFQTLIVHTVKHHYCFDLLRQSTHNLRWQPLKINCHCNFHTPNMARLTEPGKPMKAAHRAPAPLPLWATTKHAGGSRPVQKPWSPGYGGTHQNNVAGRHFFSSASNIYFQK